MATKRPTTAKKKASKRKPKTFDSQAAVAKHFGKHRQTIPYWIKKGMPRNKNGTFSIAAIEAWHKEFKGETKATDATDTNTVRKSDAEVSYAEARARKAQLEADKMEGDLISVDDHRKALETRAIFFKRKLGNIARRLGPILTNRSSPGEIEAEINKEFDKLLWEAYGKGETA